MAKQASPQSVASFCFTNKYTPYKGFSIPLHIVAGFGAQGGMAISQNLQVYSEGSISYLSAIKVGRVISE